MVPTSGGTYQFCFTARVNECSLKTSELNKLRVPLEVA